MPNEYLSISRMHLVNVFREINASKAEVLKDGHEVSQWPQHEAHVAVEWKGNKPGCDLSY